MPIPQVARLDQVPGRGGSSCDATFRRRVVPGRTSESFPRCQFRGQPSKCFRKGRVVLRCQFRKRLTTPKYSIQVEWTCDANFAGKLGSTKCPDGAGRLAMPHSADGSFPVGHLKVFRDANSVDNL